MKIIIEPVSIYSPSGVSSATKFEVRYVTYTPEGGAVADTHLYKVVEGSDVEVGSGATVVVSQSDCDTWTDDVDFFRLIATRINLIPVI